jgi:hypothetical protein
MSTDPALASPTTHWRRRQRGIAIPREHAVRQGEITRLAFVLLGRELAITFLNTDSPSLGGRPLALATESDTGRDCVKAELAKMARLGATPVPQD